MLNSVKGMMLTLASTVKGLRKPVTQQYPTVPTPVKPRFMGFPALTYDEQVDALVLVVFWVRGTFPRLRIDQLMAFAWKVMVPLAFYTIVITAIYLFYDWPAWSLTLMSLAGLGVVGYLIYRRIMAPVKRVAEIKARQEQQMAQRRAARQA